MNRSFLVGLFVLFGLGLFATGLIMIGNRHQAFAKHIELNSEFTDTFGDHSRRKGGSGRHGRWTGHRSLCSRFAVVQVPRFRCELMKSCADWCAPTPW